MLAPPPSSHTHLHLQLCLLPFHCVKGLAGPSSLALQCLDLLVERVPRAYAGDPSSPMGGQGR